MAYSDSLPARFNPEGYVNWFARNDDIFSYIRKKPLVILSMLRLKGLNGFY